MNAVEYCLLHGLEGLRARSSGNPVRRGIAELRRAGGTRRPVRRGAAKKPASCPATASCMLMIDTPDMVALHLAAMAVGAVSVALSNRAAVEELAQALAVVRPVAVVVDAEFVDAAAKAVALSAPHAQLMRRDRELYAWKAAPAAPLAPVPRQPADPAFWVMTSGTTGQPKAVEHRHGNVGICADYYRRCSAPRPPTGRSRPRGFTSPMRSATCSRTLRLGADQRAAGALGHRADASTPPCSASSRRSCSACPRSITGCSTRDWRRRRHFARCAGTCPRASGCRRRSGTPGSRRAATRSSTGWAARSWSTW